MSDMVLPSTPPPLRHGKASLVMFLLLLLLFLVLGIKMVSPYLLTLLMGVILAILFHPVYCWLVAKLRRRWLASLLTVLLIFFGILGPLFSFGAIAVRQAVELAQHLSQYQFSFNRLPQHVFQLHWARTLFGSQAQLQEQFRAAVQSFGRSASAAVLKLVAGLPGILLDLILALVACYFFLVDGTRFRLWLHNKIPLDADVWIKISRSFHDTAISTIWSAMAGALVQSGSLVIGFLLTGVPAVFVASGMAFILAWVPIIGSIPIWLIGIAYLIAQHATGKALFLLGIGILAGIGDNVVRPLALRGRGHMHGLVGLIAIFGGIDTFGIFGVFYGPILAAVVISLLQVWPSVGSHFGIEFDSDMDLPPGADKELP